jgi:holo-[acyl-carrier protein] synthase
MILGVGIDLVELDRIESALERQGDKFLNRVYTPREREECQASGKDESGVAVLDHMVKIQRLAGRFAAKEAFLKALGTGLAQGVTWQDVAVLSGAGGRLSCALQARPKSWPGHAG